MTANHKLNNGGFTLVELLVSLIIVAILAALTLSGLATVRSRRRAEITRTTIRKIHEIILPQYESYLDKRLSRSAITSFETIPTFSQRPDCYNGSSSSPLHRRIFDFLKLAAIRRTLAFELPDNWSDVGSVPMAYASGRTSAYGSYAALGNVVVNQETESAECLYMICLLSGLHPDAMEHFRAEEIGNVDNDDRPEFLDAWGRPIAFIRWPTGYDAPITLNQATDPFDPESIDTSASSRQLPGLVPLIYSPGLDQEYGLQSAVTTSAGSTLAMVNWNQLTAAGTLHFASPLPGDTSSQDNITNHDLITR